MERKLNFIKDQHEQALPLQSFNFTTQEGRREAAEYIAQHRNQNKDKYMCALSNIIDRNGRDAFGAEIHLESSGEHKGIMIAYQYISNYCVDNNFYAGATNDNLFSYMLNSVTIHELGHALGIHDPDHGGHTFGDDFCIMHAGMETITNELIYKYVNPHFCENHVNFIKTQGQKIAGVIR